MCNPLAGGDLCSAAALIIFAVAILFVMARPPRPIDG